MRDCRLFRKHQAYSLNLRRNVWVITLLWLLCLAPLTSCAQNAAEREHEEIVNSIKSYDTDRALELLNRQIRQHPKDSLFKDERADVYLMLGKLPEAINDLTEVINEVPVTTGVAYDYDKRGNAYLRQKDYAKAVSDFTKAVEINPEAFSEGGKLDRAKAFMGLSKYDSAIEDLTSVIKVAPPGVPGSADEAYRLRSQAYAKIGRMNDSRNDALIFGERSRQK